MENLKIILNDNDQKKNNIMEIYICKSENCYVK